MAAETYTIGLDFGTLSGRGILVRCSDGEITAEAVKEYTHGVMTQVLPDGETPLDKEWALEDPADYLEVLDTVIPALLKDTNVDPDQIIGIGIDFTSCTMLPVDAQGVPLCMKQEYRKRRNAYAKLWKHHGADRQAQKINEILTEQGLETDVRFGGRCSSELMFPKAMETYQEDPELYAAADEFLEAGDWLTRLLTGGNKRSCSMAGYKLWWNRKDGYPSEGFFSAADKKLGRFIPEKIRGELCPVGTSAGELTAEWADRLGLRTGIAVAPAVIDSHAGAPGSGVASPSAMMLVLGTSSVLVAMSDRPFSGNGVLGGVDSAVVPGYFAYESGLACVGDLFDWYIRNMLPAAYVKAAEESSRDVYSVLNEKAERLAPGQSGILALDWWNGNKTPFVDAGLSGAIFGMTLETRPEEIYRALIEATAFATRTIAELYKEHGVQAEEIVASGGIARKNAFLMQIYADILGMRIKVAGTAQTAALGAAIYAALAAGKENGGYDSYEKAVEHMVPDFIRVYEPDAVRQGEYNKLYKLFQNYSKILGSEYRDMQHELRRAVTGSDKSDV